MTKNVLIAVNSHGDLKHYHTTSGKVLNQTDPLNVGEYFLTCDYRPDGKAFLAAGNHGLVHVFDEQTRELTVTLQGGGTGHPGHSNRVVCAKYVPDDPNLIVSGGWDETVLIWDVRAGVVARKPITGVKICGDSIDIHDGFILTG